MSIEARVPSMAINFPPGEIAPVAFEVQEHLANLHRNEIPPNTAIDAITGEPISQNTPPNPDEDIIRKTLYFELRPENPDGFGVLVTNYNGQVISAYELEIQLEEFFKTSENECILKTIYTRDEMALVVTCRNPIVSDNRSIIQAQLTALQKLAKTREGLNTPPTPIPDKSDEIAINAIRDLSGRMKIIEYGHELIDATKKYGKTLCASVVALIGLGALLKYLKEKQKDELLDQNRRSPKPQTNLMENRIHDALTLKTYDPSTNSYEILASQASTDPHDLGKIIRNIEKNTDMFGDKPTIVSVREDQEMIVVDYLTKKFKDQIVRGEDII